MLHANDVRFLARAPENKKDAALCAAFEIGLPTEYVLSTHSSSAAWHLLVLGNQLMSESLAFNISRMRRVQSGRYPLGSSDGIVD